MKIFDSHCHIDDPSFQKDMRAVLKRATEADVAAMLIAAVDRKSSQRAVALARKYPQIYASVGLHPHDAKNGDEDLLKALKELSSHAKVCAWGEIGLDFNRMYSPREDQERWFLRQLEMADALELPLIFHERDSQGRFLELLKSHPNPRRKGVVHCFSGNHKELKAYLDLGFYIGITGILTIKKRGNTLRNLVPQMPEDRILVETDAPYLTPAPQKNRIRRNEPAFVRSVLLHLAQVMGRDPEDLAPSIWNNTCRLFGVLNAKPDEL
jgi:TatD DNase family protein